MSEIYIFLHKEQFSACIQWRLARMYRYCVLGHEFQLGVPSIGLRLFGKHYSFLGFFYAASANQKYSKINVYFAFDFSYCAAKVNVKQTAKKTERISHWRSSEKLLNVRPSDRVGSDRIGSSTLPIYL